MKSVHCIHYVVRKNFADEPVADSHHKYPMTDRLLPCKCCLSASALIRTLYFAFAQKTRQFPLIQIYLVPGYLQKALICTQKLPASYLLDRFIVMRELRPGGDTQFPHHNMTI